MNFHYWFIDGGSIFFFSESLSKPPSPCDFAVYSSGSCVRSVRVLNPFCNGVRLPSPLELSFAMFAPRYVTAFSPVNMALIKYWGKTDEEHIVPCNASLSLTLDAPILRSVATVAVFDASDPHKPFPYSTLSLNGDPAAPLSQRLTRATDAIISFARTFYPLPALTLQIVSFNTFPTAAGLASSASGLAACVVALAAALGVDRTAHGDVVVSAAARLGSGSACRSTLPGVVVWSAHPSPNLALSPSFQSLPAAPPTASAVVPTPHVLPVDVVRSVPAANSHAHTLVGQTFPSLRMVVVVMGSGVGAKSVGSTSAMSQVTTSPRFSHRLKCIPVRLRALRAALAMRCMCAVSAIVTAESESLHSVMETQTPPVSYRSATALRVRDVVCGQWSAARCRWSDESLGAECDGAVAPCIGREGEGGVSAECGSKNLRFFDGCGCGVDEECGGACGCQKGAHSSAHISASAVGSRTRGDADANGRPCGSLTRTPAGVTFDAGTNPCIITTAAHLRSVVAAVASVFQGQTAVPLLHACDAAEQSAIREGWSSAAQLPPSTARASSTGAADVGGVYEIESAVVGVVVAKVGEGAEAIPSFRSGLPTRLTPSEAFALLSSSSSDSDSGVGGDATAAISASDAANGATRSISARASTQRPRRPRPFHDATGLMEWGGSVALRRFLLTRPDLVCNKTVVELGCGIAAAGAVTAALCGANASVAVDGSVDSIVGADASLRPLVHRRLPITTLHAQWTDVDLKERCLRTAEMAASASPRVSEATLKGTACPVRVRSGSVESVHSAIENHVSSVDVVVASEVLYSVRQCELFCAAVRMLNPTVVVIAHVTRSFSTSEERKVRDMLRTLLATSNGHGGPQLWPDKVGDGGSQVRGCVGGWYEEVTFDELRSGGDQIGSDNGDTVKLCDTFVNTFLREPSIDDDSERRRPWIRVFEWRD